MQHTVITTADDAIELVDRIAHNPGHHVLLAGPVGSGKTMIARRIAAAMPDFEKGSRELLEHEWIFHGAGLRPAPCPSRPLRPFRAPHHTCSAAALCGGGVFIRPGELSLSHGGVLFLDNAPEFRQHVLGSVAHIVEAGEATICRGDRRVTLPAKLWALVTAATLCPCGHMGRHGRRRCQCSAEQVTRYTARLDVLEPLFTETIALEWPEEEELRFGKLLPVRSGPRVCGYR